MVTHTVNLNQLNDMPPIVKTINKGKYTIRTLESEFLANSDLNMRIYRSLITKSSSQDILCIAPAQSMPIDDFQRMANMCQSQPNEIRTTEIIEGTMVNLFWDDDKWEIATKRSVGGNNHFFRNQYFPELPEPEQKTFRQMFLDGLGALSLDSFTDSLNLSKSCCYSFVMQHPCNHIVTNVNMPATYLVSCYEINNNSCCYVDVFSLRPTFENTNVKFPRFFDDLCDPHTTSIDNAFLNVEDRRYLVGQETSILNKIGVCMRNPLNSFSIPGVMVTHIPTGFRASYENVKYAEIKMLRGNNPNLHYQYLVLRKINRDREFLKYFPQYSAHFVRFRQHFEAFASRIHNLYLNVRVLKITKLEEIEDKRDKYHIEKLHYEHFIPALKEHKQNAESEKPKITRKKVIEYLDSENVMVPF